jgi:hypothetical protein
MVMSEEVLLEALEVIQGPRKDTYGKASTSFNRIAGLWSTYLGVDVSASDVAALMILMKVSRSKGKPHKDNWVDICGYAALAAEMEDE